MEGGSGQDMELAWAVAGKRRNEWAAAVARRTAMSRFQDNADGDLLH